jgi:hypothetical protein
MSTKLIDALLDERRGLAARGLVERVRLVDVELARLGYMPPVTERKVDPAPGRVDATPVKKKPARKKV